MSILLIDAGNTRIKWATATGSSEEIQAGFGNFGTLENINAQELSKIPELIEITQIICASVISKDRTLEIKQLCKELMPSADWHQIDGASALKQLPTSYANPRQLGGDRRAMLLGAQQLLVNKNILVIGMGTATTIDIIANQKHIGGWILPGIMLMAETLSDNTANLPNIIERFNSLSTIKPALTTEDGIHQGVFASHAGAISLAMRYAKDNGIPIDLTILSGGNSELISNYLQSEMNIATEAQLVLKGLLAWQLMGCPS